MFMEEKVNAYENIILFAGDQVILQEIEGEFQLH